ncbi:MAG: aminoacyltransferase, partial [Lachnospiraceae bacterium]
MLSVFQIDQKEQWDNIVYSFSEYDVYWLSGYVSAFQVHGDGIPLLFFYEGCGTKGINVVMQRNISEDEHFIGKMKENDYYDFSSPYGYGGWLIEGENIEELVREYEEWCVNNRIVSEFVRFHPILKNHNKMNKAYDIIPLGKTITMDLSSPETIWSNITSKNRNVIRKARKNGIKIYNGRYPEIYEIFREIYNDTMNRDQAN